MKYDVILDGNKVDTCDNLQDVGSRIKNFFDFTSKDYPEYINDVTIHILRQEDNANVSVL